MKDSDDTGCAVFIVGFCTVWALVILTWRVTALLGAICHALSGCVVP